MPNLYYCSRDYPDEIIQIPFAFSGVIEDNLGDNFSYVYFYTSDIDYIEENLKHTNLFCDHHFGILRRKKEMFIPNEYIFNSYEEADRASKRFKIEEIIE